MNSRSTVLCRAVECSKSLEEGYQSRLLSKMERSHPSQTIGYRLPATHLKPLSNPIQRHHDLRS